MQIENDELKIKKIIYEARKTFPPILKGGFNPLYGSKYPKLEDILTAIEEPFTQYGLFLSNSYLTDERGRFLIVEITHLETGATIKSEVPLLQGKNEMQPLGSATTYARRYGICALLNINVDDDDDGNATSSNQPKQNNTQYNAPKAQAQKPIQKASYTPTLYTIEDIRKAFNALPTDKRSVADWRHRNDIEQAKLKNLTPESMEKLMGELTAIQNTDIQTLYKQDSKKGVAL